MRDDLERASEDSEDTGAPSMRQWSSQRSSQRSSQWSQRRDRIYAEAMRDLSRDTTPGLGIASTASTASTADAPEAASADHASARTAPFDLDRFDSIEALEGRHASWLAHSDAFDVDVVLEELHLAPLDDWRALDTFEERISALRGVHHPNLPQYLDAFHLDTDDGHRRLVAVREYVPGRPLRLGPDPRPSEEGPRGEGPGDARGGEADETWSDSAVEVMLDDVLGALAYLHAHDPPIVHGDVRPATIIDADEEGYILVSFAQDPASSARDSGDDPFRSPELGPTPGPSADVYGLGATAVALRAGGIQPRGVVATLRQLSLPDSLRGVLRRMVSPVAEERFADAVEAHAAFRSALGRPAMEHYRHAKRAPVTLHAPWLDIKSEGHTRRFELTCASATSHNAPCDHITLTDDAEGLQFEFRRHSPPWLLGLGVILFAALPWWLLPSSALMVMTGALWIAGMALLLGLLFARLGHRTFRVNPQGWTLSESPFRASRGVLPKLLGFEYRRGTLIAHEGGRHDFAVAEPLPVAQGRWLESYMNWRLEELQQRVGRQAGEQAAGSSGPRLTTTVRVYDTTTASR